jgi:choline dehydrogenase
MAPLAIEPFDYVIVGAGSAGCVVTSRLSEGPHVRVLLLEAPCGGRRRYWPRGKTLGGSSSLNAMIYLGGAGRDYDRWDALGAKGWGYADGLPAFRRAEDQARGASEHHGTGGPLRVEDLRCVNPLSEAFATRRRS